MNTTLKIIARSIGILAFIVVIALGVSLLLGYVYIGVKKPADATPNHAMVCDTKDIEAYNVFVTQLTSTEEQRKDKANKMQEQVDALKKKSGFDSDPTCLFIAYSAAVAQENAPEAQARQTAIKTLAGQGIYPSNALLDIVSIDSMQDRINALVPSEDDHSNPLGSG